MSETTCGFVALLGAPNAGKSTLINALVGAKVSAVSRKAQMTRAPARGIIIEGAAQIIFVDTPGLFAPRRQLDRAMADAAWAAAADADCLVFLVDARAQISEGGDIDDRNSEIFGRLSGMRKPTTLALNKIDKVERPTLLALAQRLNERQ